MSWYSGSHDTITSSPRPAASAIASMFADKTRSGIITPFGSLVEPLVYWRMTSRSASGCGVSKASPLGTLRAPGSTLDSDAVGGSPATGSYTLANTSSISNSLASPWRMRARVEAMNSSSEPIRIGSGRTIEVSPASQQPRTAVIKGRLVGPSRATWSPGIRPLACRAAPTALESSWSSRHETVSGPSGATEVPTKVTPCAASAAISRRSVVAVEVGANVLTLLDGTHPGASQGRPLAWVAPMSTETTSSERAQPDAADVAPPFRYNAALATEIELRWQDRWDADHTFETPNPVGDLADPGKLAAAGDKLFILDMFPYPSDYGLHVGHPLGFIGTDVYARYQRMAGRNVLYTMGFDAFGLPAEQFAVQTGQHPAVTTADNVVNYRKQLRRLGMSHDSRRSVETTDPRYYKWTQWIFARIFDSWFDPDTAAPDGGVGPRPADRRARRRVRGR